MLRLYVIYTAQNVTGGTPVPTYFCFAENIFRIHGFTSKLIGIHYWLNQCSLFLSEDNIPVEFGSAPDYSKLYMLLVKGGYGTVLFPEEVMKAYKESDSGNEFIELSLLE